MKIREEKNKTVSRGRRYSPGEKVQILEDAEGMGVAAAADKHRCSKWTIYDWRKKKARDARVAETQPSPPSEASDGDSEQAAATESQDERQQLVLKIWRQQPGLGPSQIRNQLKRKGFKISVNEHCSCHHGGERLRSAQGQA